jgi:hypothetical protein
LHKFHIMMAIVAKKHCGRYGVFTPIYRLKQWYDFCFALAAHQIEQSPTSNCLMVAVDWWHVSPQPARGPGL